MSRIQAVCFDLDGTLYDLKKQRRKLWKWMLRHPFVLSAWQKETAAMRGVRSQNIHNDIALAVAEKTRISANKAHSIIQKVIFEEYPATFSPKDLLPGLSDLFDELDRRGMYRAVVSDHPTDAKLRGLGQLEGWTCRVDCSGLGALKPLPDGLEVVAEHLECSPSELMLIGDRMDTDWEMAKAAGALSLIRGSDWSTGKELADLVLHHLDQE